MARKREKSKPAPKAKDAIKEKERIDEKNLTLCMACNKYKSSKCFYVSYNINRDKKG